MTSATVMAVMAILLALGGCTGRRPEPAAPPPIASAPPPSSTPDLMGGPPTPAVADAQPAVAERAFTAMAPIANPEDMSADERARVYGDRYDRTWRDRHARWAADHPARYSMGHGPRAERWRTGRRHHRLEARPWRAGEPGRPVHRTKPRRGVETGPAVPVAPSALAPSPPVPSPAAAAPQASRDIAPNLDWLSIPGARFISVPGIGRIATKFITAGVLALLALALLAYAASPARGTAARRRPTRNAVGPGPSLAGERSVDPAHTRAAQFETPVAPFPHREMAEPADAAGRPPTA